MWDLSDRRTRGTRRRPGRRALAAGLGVGAVVVSAAAAQASPGGDGFLRPSTDRPAATPTTSATAPIGAIGRNGRNRMAEEAAVRTAVCAAVRAEGMSRPGRTAFGAKGWAKGRLTVRAVVNPVDRTFNQLLGINDAGVAVGYFGSGEAGHPNHGYAVRPPYRAADFRARDVPGAAQTQDIGINRSGVEVGFFVKDGVTSGFVRVRDRLRAVRYPDADPRGANQLLGINNRGIAAGFFTDRRGHTHGFLYDACRDTFRRLSLPVPADDVQATGVNDSGVVSGFVTHQRRTRGFVLERQRFATIKLGDDISTQPLGIDNAGDVVGSFDQRGRTRGFVWSRGKARIIDVPQSRATVVNGLNDRGQIVGFVTQQDQRVVGFLAG